MSWSRSRPASPGSPAGACCAPRWTPRRTSGHRVVYSDEQVLVICPFWSGAPYEMLVIPRAHGPHLHHSPPTDLVAVGKALKVALGSLRDVVGDVAYNLVFHSAPYRAPEPYHWHVHVVPKLTTVAGFELGHRRADQHREPGGGGRGAGRPGSGGPGRLTAGVAPDGPQATRTPRTAPPASLRRPQGSPTAPPGPDRLRPARSRASRRRPGSPGRDRSRSAGTPPGPAARWAGAPPSARRAARRAGPAGSGCGRRAPG